MTNWDDLRFLVALSRTGTMTAAARMLGTNTATVSRRIERLSETLGMPAFVKTTEGWQPSEAVSPLIQLAQSFDGELRSALNNRAVGGDSEPVSISLGSLPVITAAVLFPGLGSVDSRSLMSRALVVLLGFPPILFGGGRFSVVHTGWRGAL